MARSQPLGFWILDYAHSRPESEGVKGVELTPPCGQIVTLPWRQLDPRARCRARGERAEGAVVVASFNNLSQALKKYNAYVRTYYSQSLLSLVKHSAVTVTYRVRLLKLTCIYNI